jgi:hypothetical protein
MHRLNLIFSVCLIVIMSACSNKSGNTERTMESSNDVRLNAIFPKGEEISNSNFEGVAYLQWLMNDTENFDCTLGNVTFEPGCRNSWHSHPGGQILIVIAGEGYYQERGKPIQLIKKRRYYPHQTRCSPLARGNTLQPNGAPSHRNPQQYGARGVVRTG